jgi:hypothetical protein
MLYQNSASRNAVMQGNTRWNWGEIKEIWYLNGPTPVKIETNHWKFRGHSGDTSPIKLATVAPKLLRQDDPSTPGPDSTNAIYLNFTHKQLDSVVTRHYFGSQTVTSRESYEYNDGTLLAKRTETSGDGKVQRTEYAFAHEVAGLPYSIMKDRNMRSQLAQTCVKDKQDTWYTAKATTWKNENGKYLPYKEYRWRNKFPLADLPPSTSQRLIQ